MIATTPSTPFEELAVLAEGAMLQGDLEIDGAIELRRLWREFASDFFQGRRYDRVDGMRAADRLASCFANAGLSPMPGWNGFSQPVPIERTSFAAGAAQWSLLAGGERLVSHGPDLAFARIHSGSSERLRLQGAEVVFAGHGIHAPEIAIEDFADMDLGGRIVAVLHGYTHPDPRLCELDGGYQDRTRWTTKVQEVRKRGAAGVMFICQPSAKGYPFRLIADTLGAETAGLIGERAGGTEPFAELWLEGAFAAGLLDKAGRDLSGLIDKARHDRFRLVPLAGLTVDLDVNLISEPVVSKNIAGFRPGRDNSRGAVLLMAHWDHLGANYDSLGARVFNGAIDNASGMAGLALLPRLLKDTITERPIVFLSTTGEEFGFLGARHFLTRRAPELCPVDAVINLDAFFPLGRTRDIKLVGRGLTTLDELIEQAAAEYGKYVRPDPLAGNYLSSDHICFAQAGIPTVQLITGIDVTDGGPDVGQARRNDLKARIHTQADVFDDDWDVSSVFEDIQIIARSAILIADLAERPNWKPGAPYAAGNTVGLVHDGLNSGPRP
ncbi:M28 family peptidase [Rhizobium rhizogenes]|uniref:Peptidase (M20/M25/M40 family) n=1 Tax=Rhizobium rhizogenes (strain K84 / ATCC BAA-868) TaxID=311403 RepID=B9JNZ7_RHIR8|nr:peptidase (M20/M25/M40 family) [Rhizobium rhizogenes K84]